MGLGKNGIIFISTCVIAIALILVGALVLMNDDNDNISQAKEIDITGQWHAVAIEHMYMNDTVTVCDLGTEQIADYDIYIYENYGGVVNGFFYKFLFAGAYSEGVIVSDVIDSDTGLSYHVKAFVSNANNMQIIATAYNPDGNANFALTGAYTKDRSPVSLIDVFDITGNWNCTYGKYSDPDSINEIEEKGTINVTFQDNSVFGADLEQIIDQKMILTHLVGGFSRTTADGYRIGLAIDDEGYIWNIYCTEDKLVINTCTETDAFSGTSEIVSSLRMYSRGTDLPYIEAPIDLQGTTWNGFYSSTVDENGIYTETGMIYTIEFSLQEDTIVMGTIKTGSNVCALVGAIYSSDPIAINVITENSEYRIGKIIILNENEFRFLTNGNESLSKASALTYERMDENIKNDIVGHWYNANFYGYDEADNYVTISDYPAPMHLYELTIYGVSGDTFYGYYRNCNISGAYVNGTISFRNESSNGYLQFDGTLLSSGYMVVSLKYYVFSAGESQGVSSAWSGFFSSRELDDAKIPIHDADLDGEWNIISALSFSNETDYALLGTKLNVTHREDNVFMGTMEQTDSNNNVVIRPIKGVIENYTTDSKDKLLVYGTAIDDVGVYWTFILYNNEYLIMHGALMSEVATNKLVSTERIYTRSGQGEIPNMDRVDILDTEWTKTSMYIKEPNGNYYDDDIDYKIKFTRTERVLFYGWSHYGEDIGGQVAGYLIDNKIYIRSMYGSSTGAPDSGFGWITDDTMVLIEFYRQNGKWFTAISTFEKTNGLSIS